MCTKDLEGSLVHKYQQNNLFPQNIPYLLQTCCTRMNINLAPFVQNLRELVAAPPFTSNPLLMFSTESKPNRMRRETSSEATRSTPLLPARGSDYVIYKYTLAVGSLASIPFPLSSSLLLAYRAPFGHKLSANLSLMSYFRTLYQDLHHPVEASVYLFLSSMHN